MFRNHHKKPNPQQKYDYEEQRDKEIDCPELGTLERWISGLMLDPLIFLNLEIKKGLFSSCF